MLGKVLSNLSVGKEDISPSHGDGSYARVAIEVGFVAMLSVVLQTKNATASFKGLDKRKLHQQGICPADLLGDNCSG
jgi:hypothetical protein